MTVVVVSSALAILFGVALATEIFMARHYRLPNFQPIVQQTRPSRLDALTRGIGRTARSLLRLPADPAANLRAGRSLLGLALVAALSMFIALVIGVVLFIVSVSRRRRKARADEHALQDRLAEIVDLYAVALHSGHNVTTATSQVATWLDGDIGQAFSWCCEQTQQGRQQSDVLEDLPARIGEAIRPLVAALIAHDRHGAPISIHLAQLATDTRVERRRRAESAARRLPVTLLFPLVVCVLPAFLLLTVVPVVAEAFANLGLNTSR